MQRLLSCFVLNRPCCHLRPEEANTWIRWHVTPLQQSLASNVWGADVRLSSPRSFPWLQFGRTLQMDHGARYQHLQPLHVCRIAVGVLLIIPRHSFWSILRWAQDYHRKRGVSRSRHLACHRCWHRYRQSAKSRKTSTMMLTTASPL